MERTSPFEGIPFPELEETGGEAHLLLLASHSHRTNHKQDDTQRVRLYYQPRLTYRNFYSEKSFQNTTTISGFIPFQYPIFTKCGETKTFPKELKTFIKQPYDFEYAQRVKHPCHFVSKQSAVTTSHLPYTERDLADQEVHDMLRKDAISKAEQLQEQFLSSIFLIKKRDWGTAL